MTKIISTFTVVLLYTLSGIAQTASFSTLPAAVNGVLTNCEDSEVLFSNTTVGGINTINWQFEGGNPGSSNALGPHQVTFNNPGTYTVSLSINGGAPTSLQVVVQNNNPSPNLNLLIDNTNGSGFGTYT